MRRIGRGNVEDRPNDPPVGHVLIPTARESVPFRGRRNFTSHSILRWNDDDSGLSNWAQWTPKVPFKKTTVTEGDGTISSSRAQSQQEESEGTPLLPLRTARRWIPAGASRRSQPCQHLALP